MFKILSIILFLALTYHLMTDESSCSMRQVLTDDRVTYGALDNIKNFALGLPEMAHPNNNPPTLKKIVLGRKLFMDRRLSHNNTISCGMCHIPEQGFTTNELATAVGIEGRSHRRNSPTIFNVGYYKTLFHDGREFTLENQVISPMMAFNEMGNPSIGHVIEKIRSFDDYNGLFEEAFDGPVSLQNVSQAIAAYERSLISGNSRFDRWYYGDEKDALTQEEVQGFEVFKGKGACVTCHLVNDDYALFTDQTFHNTGIGWARNNKVIEKKYDSDTFPVQLAPGVIVQVARGLLEKSSEKPLNDVGRFEVTENPEDSWKYKTPGLRNLVVSAPYMHDGSLSTLEEVIDFYDKGGDDNPLKSPLLKPLALTQQEKDALVAFLRTLTGDNIKQFEQEARKAFVENHVN